jgi:hypothetical protein
MKLLKRLSRYLRWSKTSYVILSGFLLIIFLIGYVWWPLLEAYLSYFNPDVAIWQQIDLLLIGNFLVMSVLITINANLKRDIPFALIALFGGYIIESWGTLSGLWTYYTFETPPLWIIPAWPIAALSVNRLYTIANQLIQKVPETWFKWAYWPVFGVFIILLMDFIWPTLTHPLTLFSLFICLLTILTTKEKRSALLILLVGSALGYFLERWGTTRLCWAYYIGGTPPFFTVVAHGMASIAVWRVYKIYIWLLKRSEEKWLIAILPVDN